MTWGSGYSSVGMDKTVRQSVSSIKYTSCRTHQVDKGLRVSDWNKTAEAEF